MLAVRNSMSIFNMCVYMFLHISHEYGMNIVSNAKAWRDFPPCWVYQRLTYLRLFSRLFGMKVPKSSQFTQRELNSVFQLERIWVVPFLSLVELVFLRVQYSNTDGIASWWRDHTTYIHIHRVSPYENDDMCETLISQEDMVRNTKCNKEMHSYTFIINVNATSTHK